MSFRNFIKNDPSFLLLIIIPTAIIAFVYIGFFYYFEGRKMKLKATVTRNQEVDLQAEQDDSTTVDKID